jgi:catechol 2,3-dioxygenase-like lactoylglutathione lyase family enzyme
MIDHVGFPVSDYPRSKAFYEKALAPLGYVLVMEVQQNQFGAKAAGFGAGGKPDFWSGLNKPLHVAIATKDRAAVDASTRPRWRPARRITARRAYVRTIIRTTTAAFVLDPDGHNIEGVCHAAP